MSQQPGIQMGQTVQYDQNQQQMQMAQQQAAMQQQYQMQNQNAQYQQQHPQYYQQQQQQPQQMYQGQQAYSQQAYDPKMHGQQVDPNNPNMQQQPYAVTYPEGVNPALAGKVNQEQPKENKNPKKGCGSGLNDIKDDPDRRGFVIKVYGIVSCQLLLTVLGTLFVYNSEDAKEFVREQYWITYACIIVGIAISCALTCCRKHARQVPKNYILLTIFTICWTYMVAGFTQWFEAEDVLMAAGLTVAMVIGLTFFACCCKVNLSLLAGVAMGGSFALLPLIFFFIFFPSRLLFQILAYFIILLTSVYIIFDTRLIMDKRGLSLDEYIIGALMLYTDIIQLFMWLLSLMGGK